MFSADMTTNESGPIGTYKSKVIELNNILFVLFSFFINCTIFREFISLVFKLVFHLIYIHHKIKRVIENKLFQS